MSMLPSCTCDRKGSGFPVMFGQFDKGCPRHGSSASWLEEHMARRAAALEALREQALSRPVHGGYPDADATPGVRVLEKQSKSGDTPLGDK